MGDWQGDLGYLGHFFIQMVIAIITHILGRRVTILHVSRSKVTLIGEQWQRFHPSPVNIHVYAAESLTMASTSIMEHKLSDNFIWLLFTRIVKTFHFT